MKWNVHSTLQPVGLTLSATPRTVRTLSDAAQLLIRDWPCDDGDEYVIAVKACLDAMSGRISPQRFREAFLRAANEAGITAISIIH